MVSRVTHAPILAGAGGAHTVAVIPLPRIDNHVCRVTDIWFMSELIDMQGFVYSDPKPNVSTWEGAAGLANAIQSVERNRVWAYMSTDNGRDGLQHQQITGGYDVVGNQAAYVHNEAGASEWALVMLGFELVRVDDSYYLERLNLTGRRLRSGGA